MDYLYFVPGDLVEIIIAFLNSDDLISFGGYYHSDYEINWYRVFLLCYITQ